jgi:hypothetical protein
MKVAGIEETSDSATAVDPAPAHRAVAPAGGKPAKKRLAPTLVTSSLN